VLLTDHLGLAGLRECPDYATRETRKRNRLALKAALETVLRTRPARDWAKELNRIGVPAGAVLTIPEVLGMAQIATRGFLSGFEDVPGVGRDIEVVATGLKLDGGALKVETPPPQLGQNNTEVLAELGFSGAEIEALRDEGAI